MKARYIWPYLQNFDHLGILFSLLINSVLWLEMGLYRYFSYCIISISGPRKCLNNVLLRTTYKDVIWHTKLSFI